MESDPGQLYALAQCPSIVPVHETAVLDSSGECTLLLRMELMTTLSEWLEEAREVGEIEAITVGVAVARALAHCCGQFVAHRDIKPQNIFRSAKGGYKLGDFGIARRLVGQAELTRTARCQFTPLYAAPEVLMQTRIDPFRADIYSLGLVLYRMVNGGDMPFGPCGQEDLLEKRRMAGEAPPPKHASRPTRAVLWKALRRDSAERYASATAMLSDFEAAALGRVPSVLAEYDAWEGEALLTQGEYERAAKLLRGALDAGHQPAAKSLGVCLYHGFGVPQDTDRALSLLLPFTDEGDAQTCLLIGKYYYGETVRRKDLEKAVRYFTIAAKQGLADAQFHLGYCYRKGYHVAADDNEAQKWFRRAPSASGKARS